MKKTQYDTILKHLTYFGKITSWEAFQEYGITRLSAIIYNLRDAGYNISSEKRTTTNRFGNKTSFAEYKLIRSSQPELWA